KGRGLNSRGGMQSTMTFRKGILTAIATGTGYIAYNHFLRRSSIDLHGKIVLMTGGSRELGLALAREFGLRGAIIAICARDEAELNWAQSDLTDRRVRSHLFVCDITDSDQVSAMVARVTEQLGRIDILVNNPGIIRVGSISEMDIEDFDEA